MAAPLASKRPFSILTIILSKAALVKPALSPLGPFRPGQKSFFVFIKEIFYDPAAPGFSRKKAAKAAQAIAGGAGLIFFSDVGFFTEHQLLKRCLYEFAKIFVKSLIQ
jgi:hypothetical protein